MLRRFLMKYEAPICENVMLENTDIRHARGYPNEDGGKGDTTPIPMPTFELNQVI